MSRDVKVQTSLPHSLDAEFCELMSIRDTSQYLKILGAYTWLHLLTSPKVIFWLAKHNARQRPVSMK